MSFLKKLFGGGGSDSSGPKTLDSEDYQGFTIKAIEMRAGNEYQLSGSVEKEIDGEVKVHTFIRADRLSSADQAGNAALAKGRQIVDEQGDQLFRD